MLTTRITSMVAVLALVAPAALHAQEDTLVAGDRVRIWMALQAGDPLTGSIKTVTSDSLVLDLKGSDQSVSVPMTDIAVLEVSHERDYALAGAGIGFLAGLVGGAVVANAATADEGLESLGKGVAIWLGFTFGGLATGAVIGANIKSERWEEVPLSEIRVGPSRHASDGISVSASLRW